MPAALSGTRSVRVTRLTRKALAGFLTAALLGCCVVVLAQTPQNPVSTVRLCLRDAESGNPISGVVRIFHQDENKPLSLAGLLSRSTGLNVSGSGAGWYVVPVEGARLTLPRSKLRLEALSGLESSIARQELDLTRGGRDDIAIGLTFLFRPERSHLAAGNTHLHLRGLTFADADRYLRQIPAADGIKVLFISHLERAQDDRLYITNQYPTGDLEQFRPANLLVNNGEEHRHNFGAYGQGYGHVMFLNLKKLVRPVSLGAGITGGGKDDQALKTGINEARSQDSTVIWCHNSSGFEGISSALAGRIDALNVFDGSRSGTFEDLYYRLLNIGLRLPLSTGTDWFLYDFARVYARVTGPTTIANWLTALRAGRCQATNGPLLTLQVDSSEPGDVIALEQPRMLHIVAKGLGRHDFQQLELVHNGKVIRRQTASTSQSGWRASMALDLRVDRPGWLAVRICSARNNELEQQLFAHTSPVYVEIAGKRAFDLDAANDLLRRVEEARGEIRQRGQFSSAASREHLLQVYDQAARELRQRMQARLD
jgi:hypothetical protein